MVVRGGRAFSYAVGCGFLAALVSFVVLAQGGGADGNTGGGSEREAIVAVPEDDAVEAGPVGAAGAGRGADEVVEGAMLRSRSLPETRPAEALPTLRTSLRAAAVRDTTSARGAERGTQERGATGRRGLEYGEVESPASLWDSTPGRESVSAREVPEAMVVPTSTVRTVEVGVTSVSASVVQLGDTRVGRQAGAQVTERKKAARGRVPEEDAFLALLASSEKTLARAQFALEPGQRAAAPGKGRAGASGAPGGVEASRGKQLARGGGLPGTGEMERECQRASILGTMPPSYCSCEVGEFDQLECRVSKAVVRN